MTDLRRQGHCPGPRLALVRPRLRRPHQRSRGHPELGRRDLHPVTHPGGDPKTEPPHPDLRRCVGRWDPHATLFMRTDANTPRTRYGLLPCRTSSTSRAVTSPSRTGLIISLRKLDFGAGTLVPVLRCAVRSSTTVVFKSSLRTVFCLVLPGSLLVYTRSIRRYASPVFYDVCSTVYWLLRAVDFYGRVNITVTQYPYCTGYHTNM